MAGKVRPAAIAAIRSRVSVKRVRATKRAVTPTLASEISRPYHSSGPKSHTNGAWTSR
jgi:hypothetical protein